MTDTDEYLALKWGTLKGYNFKGNPEAIELVRKYNQSGVSMSLMSQEDTADQKNIIFEIIDACRGKIFNAFSGEILTKEEAKKYIKSYKKRPI